MPDANQAALDFLLNRRSRPAKLLRAPYPSREELGPILTAAGRSPDHGKLEPWRFVVLEKPALARLARAAEARGAALRLDETTTSKVVSQYADSGLAVAVIFVPRSTEKVPLVEQRHSAAAVCLSLLNAALAAGWGANWLTGWAVYDADFTSAELGLAAGEEVVGVVHIGTTEVAPPDRPRPDIAAITTWMDK